MTKTYISAGLLWRFIGFLTILAISLIGCPVIAVNFHSIFPRILGNWLFFWPQMALAYYGFTYPASDMTRTFFDGGGSIAIAAIFWLVLGLILSWILRNRKAIVTLVASVPASFVAVWLLLFALRLVNVGVYLEGP